MNAIDAMVLDIDVARNRREIAAGFAALRAEMAPPMLKHGIPPPWAAYAQAMMAPRDPWAYSLAQMQAAAPDPYRFGHGLAHNAASAFGW